MGNIISSIFSHIRSIEVYLRLWDFLSQLLSDLLLFSFVLSLVSSFFINSRHSRISTTPLVPHETVQKLHFHGYARPTCLPPLPSASAPFIFFPASLTMHLSVLTCTLFESIITLQIPRVFYRHYIRNLHYLFKHYFSSLSGTFFSFWSSRDEIFSIHHRKKWEQFYGFHRFSKFFRNQMHL